MKPTDEMLDAAFAAYNAAWLERGLSFSVARKKAMSAAIVAAFALLPASSCACGAAGSSAQGTPPPSGSRFPGGPRGGNSSEPEI
jgi:hypothetical protein